MTNLMSSILWLLGQTISTDPPEWLDEMLAALRNIVAPILGVIGIAGIFLAIYIGFRLASAEEEGKRKEAKKQLLWAIIAVVGVGLLIFFFLMLEPIIESLVDWL